MLVNSLFRSRVLVGGVTAAFLLLVVPAGEYAQLRAQQAAAPATPGPANGSLVGFVYTKDMTTPVADATVKLRNLADKREYTSGPTDTNGMYKITHIAEGRYILGVTSPAGDDFNFDYVVLLKGNDMAKLSLALAPGGQSYAASAGPKSFFLSPAGIALMVIAVGVVLYAVFAKEEPVSPIR
jgi:hypothetical protein